MSETSGLDQPPGKRYRTVREIMHRDFVTVAADDTLEEALSIMRLARLRHLPVERDGFLVGILSYRDLQDRVLARPGKPPEPETRSLAGLAVEQAMMDSPYVISPETALETAASRICRLRIGCLPVVERSAHGPQLVGLVTESDLLRAAYPES
jgi:CBS domain-containing protein